MEKKSILQDVASQAGNRRSFVRKLGMASAAVAGAAVLAEGNKAEAAAGFTDADILNFALNLEYLEAEFYTVATTGLTIDNFGVSITGSGTAGKTTGGSLVPWNADPTVKNIAAELAIDERTHVSLLQGAITSLGGTPIAKPAINLGALGIGYASQNDFLVLGRAFEEIGVTAYGGAAPLVTNSAILGYAARILATEAEHVGALRLLIAQAGIPTSQADGADFLPLPSGPQYFSTNSSGITEVRTPGQVLYIAFGGAANATSGGFFPSGVNGLFATSSAAAAQSDGAIFYAAQNPIPIAAGSSVGQTTLTWYSQASASVEIHIGSPSGALLTQNAPSGSIQTGEWVTDGMLFFLQDTSYGKPLTAANTLATLVVHLA